MNFRQCRVEFRFFFFLWLADRSGRLPAQTVKTSLFGKWTGAVFPGDDSPFDKLQLRNRRRPSSRRPRPKTASAPAEADAWRPMPNAPRLTYISYDFEVHLEPSQHSIAVQARMTAATHSDKPLERIALQLSSSLHWDSIQLDGKPAKFETETVDSDIDHTGELTEAVVKLATPLAPGSHHSDECDLFRYCGPVGGTSCCGWARRRRSQTPQSGMRSSRTLPRFADLET